MKTVIIKGALLELLSKSSLKHIKAEVLSFRIKMPHGIQKLCENTLPPVRIYNVTLFYRGSNHNYCTLGEMVQRCPISLHTLAGLQNDLGNTS